jgi:hypothetical protein
MNNPGTSIKFFFSEPGKDLEEYKAALIGGCHITKRTLEKNKILNTLAENGPLEPVRKDF